MLRCEATTLAFVKQHLYFHSEHSRFAVDAGRHYDTIQRNLPGLKFISHLDVGHERGSLMVVVAGLIERNGRNKFTNVSYFVAVCKKTSKNKAVVMRKFHFDICGEAGGRRRQEAPVSHLQSPGSFHEYFTSLGCAESQFRQGYDWLSEPRIMFWPMSLALLIDLILHEFPNRESIVFRRDPIWRKLVRDNEALLLKPFHQLCFETIADRHNHQQTLADVLYVL